MRSILAMDIGGTSMRFCVYDLNGGKQGEAKVLATPNRLSHPGSSVSEIQQMVWAIVREVMQSMLAERRAEAIGISFAGPINFRGEIVGAPTIWGQGNQPFPLAEKVAEATKRPCFVINDVSAAGWKYSISSRTPFSVVTISSGVGNKVFSGNDFMVNQNGYGGELGHCTAPGFGNRFKCECGGVDHIGAISSGRGVINLLREEIKEDAAGFRNSGIHHLAGGNAGEFTTTAFVAAVKGGDAFANRVLVKSAGPIAYSLSNLYAMTGIERHIFIGGFANALGRHYKSALLEAMRPFSFFGRTAPLPDMIEVSPTGDLDCLSGVAAYSFVKLGEVKYG